MKFAYEWNLGRRWARVWCAVFSHRTYKAKSPNLYEIGCERCGLFFRAESLGAARHHSTEDK